MEEIKIRPRKDIYEEIDKLSPDPNNFWQIDFLKVWMIALVLMDHSIPHRILGLFYSLAWERIAIPVFMVVLGFNWGKSMMQKKNQSLWELYSWRGYFKSKIQRFIVPFAIIYGLSIIYLILANIFIGPNFLSNVYPNPADIPILNEPILKLALILPVWGPGNWFIPMIFLTILIFPLLFKLFTHRKWSSWLMLACCFLIEAAYQLGINLFYLGFGFDYRIDFFTFTPFMLLSAIGLGLWLSINHRWDSPRNLVIWFLGLASTVHIFYALFRGRPIYAQWVLFDYNLFVYPYSALIVMIVLNVLPKSPSGPAFRFISTLGKSTYHILMTQIFYFSVIYGLLLPFHAPFGTVHPPYSFNQLGLIHANYFWYYPVNVLITFTIGTLWYSAGKQLSENRRKLQTRVSENQLKIMKARGWVN